MSGPSPETDLKVELLLDAFTYYISTLIEMQYTPPGTDYLTKARAQLRHMLLQAVVVKELTVP